MPISSFLIVLSFALLCIGLLPQAEAVSPAPGRGYPGNNTAEGANAVFQLTTGPDNTDIGYHALFKNNTGQDNTVTGPFALSSGSHHPLP
jgi:hypothetical protein